MSKRRKHDKYGYMKRIMMLFGGRSEEHDVSLRSASFIWKSLQEAGYSIIPVGISRKGLWYIQKNEEFIPDSLTLTETEDALISLKPGVGFFTTEEKKLDVDLVFPVLHGTFGEDGCLQGMLEIAGIPYVGADQRSSAIAMDKITAKILWEKQDLPVVPYSFVEKWQWISPDFDKGTSLKNWMVDLGLPLFVKPSNAGSSVGVSKAEDRESLEKAIEEAFRHDTRVLLEKAIDAREIELSVVGNYQPETFQAGEIAPQHSFYDYDAKYIDPDGAVLLIPAEITEEQNRKAREMALSAYKTLSLKGLSRVDLFLDKNDGSFYINEINTLPGFTSISMFPQLCKAGGLDAPSLMKRLIQLALEHYIEKNSLNF